MSEQSSVANPQPAMSIEEAEAKLTAEGMPFEIEVAELNGIRTPVWKHAPPSLALVLEASAEHGEDPYIVYEDERLSYAEHYRQATRFAHLLRDEYGIRTGDRVVIAMRNYPEWPIAFWGIIAAGAVAVPLNAWWTGEELEYGLTDSGASLVVMDGERVDRLAPHLGGRGLAGAIAVRAQGALPEGIEHWQSVMSGAQSKPAALPEAGIGPDDDATIFYTSGTTGRPKGAQGSHRNICTNLVSSMYTRAFAMLRNGETPPFLVGEAPEKTASLLSVPFFHATGCHSVLVTNTYAGNKLVLMYKWDPERALELIERERVNMFGGVPAMVWQVLESPRFGEHDLSSVQSIGYGGAPAPAELVARIREAFPEVSPSNGYGLTETSSITTMNSGVDYLRKPDSVGRPVPVCEVRATDPEGNEVPPGEVGELWIHGPNIVKGYWNKPEATAESFVDGWFRSGDLARIDSEGFVYIVDRAKDMIIRGGENIYSVEVENALYEHPSVMDAAVFGVPHRVLGEEVAAAVQVKPGAQLTESELLEYVGQHLAAFKVPRYLDLRDEPLPRNANGKILKRDLKEAFGT